MTRKNTLKTRLKAGETIAAAWLELGTPEVAELLVYAGWDVIVIDCEHGVAGLEDGLGLIRAVEAAGGEAIVRVPDSADATLKRALDRGARSIMVPQVSSVAMAQQVAASCLYPPRGRRGYAAPIARASQYGKITDYAKTAHDDLLLMAQIEHIDTVGEVAAIAGVEGIDMAFVGPNDFSASMGHLEDMTHPDVQAQLLQIENTVRESGMMLGTVTGAGRDHAELKAAGYQLIAGSNDIGLLVEAARAARQEATALLAE